MHVSRLLSRQVLTPLLEHNLRRILVEKYGLADCDLQHEIDRSLDYHENLDNILSIHGLADQVTHYDVQRELELIEKQLERKFHVDETETSPQHIESKPIMMNPVRNEIENGFDRIFEYFDLFYSEKLTPAVIPTGAARMTDAKPKLEQSMTGRLLGPGEGKHQHDDGIDSGKTESFGKLYAEFIRKTGNRSKILRERRKARELLNKWEKILSPDL